MLFYLYVFLFPVVTHASVVSFEENYVYNASEADSKIIYRAISLLQDKRLLLERLGTYLELKTEILQEEWNGKTYSLTARIQADPDGVAQTLDTLRQDDKGENEIKKLETINEKSIDKINELKRELARVQENLILINRDFSKSSKIINSWESFENGLVLLNIGKYKKAISAFNAAIENNPKYMHFFQRGIAYMKMKQYQNAIKDFSSSIGLAPRAKNAYFQRGMDYRKIGKKAKGLQDIKRAAKLGSGNTKRWLKKKAPKGVTNKFNVFCCT